MLFLSKSYISIMPYNVSEIPSASDELLFYRIQRNDEEAFEILFLRHYQALCAYARSFVEPADGQEIVSDIMIWLWENRKMHVFEISLKSYLFKAVKNRCLTLINRNEIKQRIEKSLFTDMQSQYDDPDYYIVEELTGKIEDALSRLPDTYRESFEMSRFHNLTYQEIADKLSVSYKTVDYRIQQALKQLRIELKEYLPLLLPFLIL